MNSTAAGRRSRRRRDRVRGCCGQRTGPSPTTRRDRPGRSTTASRRRASPTEAIVNGGTWIFGSASDPTTLDAILIQDGESFRIAQQIYETLIELKPGTTERSRARPGQVVGPQRRQADLHVPPPDRR